MEKTACAEVLRDIARGNVDLDKISEIMRYSDLVIRRYQDELEGLRRVGDQLQIDLEEERKACDDLVRRMADLHEENRLAQMVFRTEIEGRRALTGAQLSLDLEALDMAGLIREREKTREELGKTL